MDLMSVQEALRYFGLPTSDEGYDRLEEIAAEHDLDIELDEFNKIKSVEPSGVKEALFQEHLKTVGHRPDSADAMEKAKREKETKDRQHRDKMEKDKVKLKVRVQARKLKEH